MPTYKEIQNYVKTKYGFAAQSCWIAHMKEELGLAPRPAPNRKENGKRVKTCPPDKQEFIKEALTIKKMP